ncbi:MAG: tetratricopeptide repeat protein [Chromatiales bacterium]|nr:tetratricopeptide repeat protein [Chromatiales bacterium]
MVKPPQRSHAAPSQVQAAVQSGMQLMQAGRLREAEQALRQALALDPDNADALQLLGLLAARANQLDWAEQFLQKAARLQPRRADVQSNLGNVLLSLGQIEEAIAQFRNATRIDPTNTQVWFNLGNALRAGKQPEAAVAAYRKALARQPDHLPSLVNLGHALREQDLLEEAAQAFRQAVALAPQHLELRLDLGHVCNLLLHIDEAIEHYGAVLAVQPEHPKALVGMAAARLSRHDLDEAKRLCRAAILVRPDMAEAYFYLAKTHVMNGQRERAVPAILKAIELAAHGQFADPGDFYVTALTILKHTVRHRDVLSMLDRHLQDHPDDTEALLFRHRVRQEMCDWRGMREDIRHLIHSTATTTPFAALAISGLGSDDHLLCAQREAEAINRKTRQLRIPIATESTRRPRARLRIGYVSSDLREHAVAHLAVQIFERHDREHFEVFAYSNGNDDGSAIRKRLEKAFDHFIDTRDLSHEQAAQRIRNDGIDVLIDLNGYTQNARTEVFALRPAPIQVNWLGYPGTLGADFIDYIVVDPFVAPPDQAPFYTEKQAYLPDVYLPRDQSCALAAIPAREQAGLPEQGFVFCCFNNAYKITPDIFDLWCGLLREVPGSVLWLSVKPDALANLQREAEARGIDSARLIVAPRVPSMADHLARLSLADLFLDTLPYNAHTTASDALWAGVPVVTCAGETFPSRVAGSLLRAVGLPELVTERLDRYRDLALRLATQPDELKAIRHRLAENRSNTPLFDSERFTRNLEGLYRRMWARHEQGLPPDMLEPEPAMDP